MRINILFKGTNESGQTIVETALILLLVLSLLFGITEFARAWYYSNTLTNAVRAGARLASTLPNSTSFQTKVKNYTFTQITSAIPSAGTNTSLINISAFASGDSNTPLTSLNNLTTAGQKVTVIAHYNMTILSGSIIPFFSGTKTLTGRATMRYEHD